MLSTPTRYEIDHRTIKLIVGVIAISLASVTRYMSGNEIDSISEAWHKGGFARDYFVGSLFAIFAFLLAYNGRTRAEMLLSKVAAFSALGVALFPCECNCYQEVIPRVHGISAAAMFLILALFCYQFHKRAKSKDTPEADRRARIYMLCGAVIILSIAAIALDHMIKNSISKIIPAFVFYGEAVGLMAFGIAWLTASRVLPYLSNTAERFNPFR